MSDLNEYVIEPLKKFYVDASYLVRKCEKPDAADFMKTAWATGVGLLIMGFIGFFVKILHIPINNILVGSGGF